ncbi:hypothetical protein KIPB_009595, partial [Kipferlia bialata]
ELMYDVFGDTVNTAARLMAKADDWDLLVSEDVASALTRAKAKRDAGQESLMGSAVSLEYICTRPALNFLKGKGLFPCRHVLFSEACLDQTEKCLGDILSDVLGGLVGRHTTWTERMLAPAQYMHRHLGLKRHEKRDRSSSTSTGLEVVQEAASTANIADTILDQPWAVIRAHFGTNSPASSTVQTALRRQTSAPFLHASETEESVSQEYAPSEHSSDGVPLAEESTSDVSHPVRCTSSPLRTKSIALAEYVNSSDWVDSDVEICMGEREREASDVSTPRSLSEASVVEGEGEGERDIERGDPALPTLSDGAPASRMQSLLSLGSSSRSRRRERERVSTRDLPCPDIQTLDAQLLDDLEGVHKSVSVKGRLSGHTLSDLTGAVWNRESLSPARRLFLALRCIPAIFKLSLKQTAGDSSIFVVIHTIIKIRRVSGVVNTLAVTQLILALVAVGHSMIISSHETPDGRSAFQPLLEDPTSASEWNYFQLLLGIQAVVMLFRVVIWPVSLKILSSSLVSLLDQSFYPEGQGEITAYRRLRSLYRRVNTVKTYTQALTLTLAVFTCSACRRVMDTMEGLEMPEATE